MCGIRDDPNCPCTEKEGLDCKLPGYHCLIMNVLNMAAFMPSKAYVGAWNDLDLLRMFTTTGLLIYLT